MASELASQRHVRGTGVNYSINELAAMFEPQSIEYIPARPGEAEDTLADIEFSKKNLDWTPQSEMEAYVSNFVQSVTPKVTDFVV